MFSNLYNSEIFVFQILQLFIFTALTSEFSSENRMLLVLNDNENKQAFYPSYHHRVGSSESFYRNQLSSNDYASAEARGMLSRIKKFSIPNSNGVSVTHMSHGSDEDETIFTKSSTRPVTLNDLKKLPSFLQQAMGVDGSVIHYHEHEHIHQHKNPVTGLFKVQKTRFNEGNGLYSPYGDQQFESTKSYYHQRDNPNKYGPRVRYKKKNNQAYEQHTVESFDEEEYRQDFGKKKPIQFKREDMSKNDKRSLHKTRLYRNFL